MTAISFELSEQEASSLRHQADEAHMTVSAFLRDLVSKKENKKKEEVVIGIKKNRFTNTPAFYVKKGKLPGEGYTRGWPDLVKMDPAVKKWADQIRL